MLQSPTNPPKSRLSVYLKSSHKPTNTHCISVCPLADYKVPEGNNHVILLLRIWFHKLVQCLVEC
jgi:hypothetical protein